MLTEPVECKSCNSIDANGGLIHCHECFKDAIRLGFAYALEQYSIWNNGEQTIGCMSRNIKDVIEQFDKDEIVVFLIEQIERKNKNG